jgi:peptidyl-prolyl cis-trans isomerase C
MKKITIGILAAGVFCGIAGAATPAAKAPAALSAPKAAAKTDWSFLPAVVAEIDGKKITREVFVKAIEKQLASAPGGMKIPQQYLEMMAGKMVTGYIDRMVLMGLVKKAGFKPSAAMAAKSMKENLAKMAPVKLQQIKQGIAMRGSTLDDEIKKQAKSQQVQDSVAIGAWINAVVVPKCKVTVAEAKDYYKKNPKQFTPPVDPAGSYRSSHILITVPKGSKQEAWDAAGKKIDGIYKRLKNGEKFEDLALKYSGCPSGKRDKGSLGLAKKGNMVPAFEKAALALKTGQTAKVKTPFGWHIIRRDKAVAKSDVLPFAKVEKKLIKGLQGQKEQAMLAALLAKGKASRKAKVLVKSAPMPMMPGMRPAPVPKAKPAAKAKPATKACPKSATKKVSGACCGSKAPAIKK